MQPGHVAPQPPQWLVAWREVTLGLLTLLPRFLRAATQCRRLGVEPVTSILRRGLAPEVTAENCAHPSNLMLRYGNRHGRYTRCAMCGARWRWDEVMGCWLSLSASSRSSLPLPSPNNTFPAATASKAKAKIKAKAKAVTASYPIQDSLPPQRTRQAPSEFDLASVMSHEIPDDVSEVFDWDD